VEANAELVRDCELVRVADEEEGGENQGRQRGDGTGRWYDLVELEAVTGGFRLKNALAAPTCAAPFALPCWRWGFGTPNTGPCKIGVHVQNCKMRPIDLAK
jgi:hypothetical protein